MSGLHDPPTALELVEAVREFLREDVVASTAGRVQFHARIAANVLHIVERELLSGEDQYVEHVRRLRTLGYDNDADLARGIRDGEVNHWDPELIDAIHASVRAKLKVSHPQYLEQPWR